MTTPNIEFEEWEQNQDQPHVTVNTNFRILDAFCPYWRVLDRSLNAPPGSPAEGACYIVGSVPTGAWVGRALNVAIYISGAWVFRVPLTGWRAYVVDEDEDVRYYEDSPASWDII